MRQVRKLKKLQNTTSSKTQNTTKSDKYFFNNSRFIDTFIIGFYPQKVKKKRLERISYILGVPLLF